MKISVIIPIFNEEKTIIDCLKSISNQSIKPYEVIVIDDGSTDNSVRIISNFQFPISNFQFLKKQHEGPGEARNFGASRTHGDILVFVDADMTFDKEFLENLTKPIREGKTKGTFTKDELVSNWDSVWARCWNFNQNIVENHRIPLNYPNEAPVFRAILRKEFEKVHGFDSIGYTDDWTLSRKLRYQSTVVAGAICYHRNPENLLEIFAQARWIGKNEFIAGTLDRKIFNLFRFSLPVSLGIGVIKSIVVFTPAFLVFKLVYDAGIFLSVLESFFDQLKYK